MTYTVWYKKVRGVYNNKGKLVEDEWHEIERVAGDYSFYVEAEGLTIIHPVRIIEQEDWTRHEFPMSEYRFKFSKERHMMTDEKIKQETGK